MKRFITLLALLAVVGCEARVTAPSGIAPTAPSDYVDRIVFELPPPPPTDTGVVASSGAGYGTFNVTYLLNRPGTNGFLHFNLAQPEGTTASNGARVSYHNGTFSGKGTLSYLSTGGTVTIDLSSVSPASTFQGCDKGCFQVGFDSATLTTGGQTGPLPGGVRIAPRRRIIGDGSVVGGF
jgi:hypothetical protein